MLKRSAKVIEEKNEETIDSDHIEIRLPKLSFPHFHSFNYKHISWNPILIVGLIISAFLLGMLTTKVQYQDTQLKNLAATANTVALAAAPSAAPTTPPPSGNIKAVDNNTDIIRGNVNAKVTLVEFADEECPYCKQFHPTMLQLMQNYGDQIRWVYRVYPLPFHQNADAEAQSTLCIQSLSDNPTTWKFIDAIYDRTTSNGTGFALDKLGPLAAEVGVDQTAFQSCLDSKKLEPTVQAEIADGNAGGVNGTPSTVILVNGKKPIVLVGAQPIDAMKAAIDAALK
jgi:protein-disulfide isomerase